MSAAELAIAPAASPRRQHVGCRCAARATDIRLRVSVPVLSVQSTVAAPKVSIAVARRVSTRERESRHAPITMKTVSTSGNSSGSIDMPSAMPPAAPGATTPRSTP